VSFFHTLTAGQFSPKTDLPTGSGKVLSTSLTPPTQPPDPGLPQTPKPVQEKSFALDPGWLVYICKSDCLYLCPSFTIESPDQSPPNFEQTSTHTQGRFLTQVWPCKPDTLTLGYLKLQNLNRSLEKNFDIQKLHCAGPLLASIKYWNNIFSCIWKLHLETVLFCVILP